MKHPIWHPLYWLSATDREALAKCPRSSHYKQATLGGFVLTSAALAALGTYGTASEVGVARPVSILAGLAAGAVVMNFDRYVIASMKRQDTWLATILGAAPRILFALAAGQVVTMVALIFIFGATISSRVATDRQHAIDQARHLILKQRAPLEKLIDERDELEEEVTEVGRGGALAADPRYAMLAHRLQKAQAEQRKAETAALCEMDGTCGSGHVGPGPFYKAKEERAQLLAAEADKLKRQLAGLTRSLAADEASSDRSRDKFDNGLIAELDGKIRAEEKELGAQRTDLVSVTAKYDGPLARWDALGEVAHDHPSMATFRFWLWLTLLLLDTSPALMKTIQLLGRMGPYEEMLEERDRETVAGFDQKRAQEEAERDLAEDAARRQRENEEAIDRYKAEKSLETAKHRIDLETETTKEMDRRIDDGQRARNLRDIEEMDSWIEPVARDLNRRRRDEWLKQILEAERKNNTPWGDGDLGSTFEEAVDGLIGRNGHGPPPSV